MSTLGHTTVPTKDVPVPRRVHLDDSGDLGARLYAARPVVWKGASDLPQVTWANTLRGQWLVIDMWSGVGGLCMSLLQMGVHFYAVAAELDEEAAQVATSNMPSILHVPSVECLTGRMFQPFLRRRPCRGIILGGGSPCQGNSLLNKDRLGLDDPRSCQPQELQRLRDELRALPETQTLDIVLFLENVASMPKSVRQQYDEWLECPPVLSDAVWCGWVHTKRLYWLCAEKGHISASCQPPPEWAWECSGETPFLKFVGRKPLPSRVSFAQGFQCLLNPDEVKQSGESAMYTFTREFYHPPDRCAQASAAAVQRFFEDGCRFPPPAYEEHNLVWRGEKWRTLEPTERAQLMGWPALAVAPARGRADLKRQRQNSFIGNGFHLFTLVGFV